MKKWITLAMSLIFVFAITGCSGSSPEISEKVSTAVDYPAAIMVDNTIYLLSSEPMPAEINESAIVGYTNSYTDGFPENNGETNFNRELNMPYAKVSGGIAVLYENEWYLCSPKEIDNTNTDIPQSTEDTVLWFNDSFFNRHENPENRMTNLFLSSLYDSPAEIDLHKLFYNGTYNVSGESSLTQKELDFLEGEGADLGLDVIKITPDEMDAVLQKYTGITLEQSKQKGLEKFYYNKDTDSYYHNVSDTNYQFVKVLSADLNEEGYTVLEYVLDENMTYHFQAVLEKQEDGSYLFLANKCLPPYTFATVKDYLSYNGLDKYESEFLTLDAVEGIAYVDRGNSISIYRDGKECGWISMDDMGNPDWNTDAELSVMEKFAGASGSFKLLNQTDINSLTRYIYQGSRTPFSYGDTEWLVQAGIFENEAEACKESTESYLVQYAADASPYTWCMFLDKYVMNNATFESLINAVSLADGCCTQKIYDKMNQIPYNAGIYIAENNQEDIFIRQYNPTLTYEFTAGDLTYRVPEGTVAKKEDDIWKLYYYSMDGVQEAGTIEVIKNEASDKEIEDIVKEHLYSKDYDASCLTASEQGWIYEYKYCEDTYSEEQKEILSQRPEGKALADDTISWKSTLLISADKKNILCVRIYKN